MAIRKKRIKVVLSDTEMEQLRLYAEERGVSMSEIIRGLYQNYNKAVLEGRGFKPIFPVRWLKSDIGTLPTNSMADVICAW